MDRKEPPSGGGTGPPTKKPSLLERATTLTAAVAATAAEGELTIVSTIDGGSVTVPVPAIALSSTLAPDDIKLDISEPVPIPAPVAAIQLSLKWIQHEWHRENEPCSDEAQTAFVKQFVAALADGTACSTPRCSRLRTSWRSLR
jgi:hypothetical protein